jgi:hypothetical protein
MRSQDLPPCVTGLNTRKTSDNWILEVIGIAGLWILESGTGVYLFSRGMN